MVASPLLCLRSLTLEESSHHVVRTLKQPSGEVHMVGNWGLLPTASSASPPVSVSGSSWKQSSAQWSLKVTAVLPTSWLQAHDKPQIGAVQPGHSWPTKTVWDNNCLLLVKKKEQQQKKRTKKPVLNPRSQRFTHMLSTRSFVVLELTFGSRIYFALIFDDGVR